MIPLFVLPPQFDNRICGRVKPTVCPWVLIKKVCVTRGSTRFRVRQYTVVAWVTQVKVSGR